MKHRFVLPLAAALVATGIIGGPLGEPALAAAGCNLESCTGKNPNTMDCSASTLETVATPSSYAVEFRASTVKSCGAVWARHQAIGDGDFYGFAVRISIERRYYRASKSGYFYTKDIDPRKSGYTLMFGRNPDYYTRACLTETSGGGATVCTHWYNSALERVSLS